MHIISVQAAEAVIPYASGVAVWHRGGKWVPGNAWQCFDLLELSAKMQHFYTYYTHSGGAGQHHQGVALGRRFDRRGYQSSFSPYCENG